MENTVENSANNKSTQIQIVSRLDIPALYSIEQEGVVHTIGELRDFQWHSILKDFLPPAEEFSIGWVWLKEDETLKTHVHPVQSMMVFYQGSGKMLGQKEGAPLQEGDIVIVPPGCEHGFIGGPGGLHGFSIQFGSGLYTDPENARVIFKDDEWNLAKLLAHNQLRLQQASHNKFFQLIQSGILDHPKKRQVFLDYLQIWVDGNQTLLFGRQATCNDPHFNAVFLQHLYEEIGHEKLYDSRKQHEVNLNNTPTKARDTILEAVTSWFSYQMFVLDNVEKTAIIHLVIENASHFYHAIAKNSLEKYISAEYFQVHEADTAHAEMGEKLLQNQSAETYRRLKEIIDQAWDMLGVMMNRVQELTEAA